ncbi:MAG: hypothetical protein HOI53_07995 [Francisellaceae bacterium]|jgi:hypothetical protein|nr:hypothetical protein [Francisellaceae bacterium]MBT6207956.1 hypothetical protein [Francisellaceae bacterium]MBT6538120.1 hypothetical protein [Francisellaceae bacterium]
MNILRFLSANIEDLLLVKEQISRQVEHTAHTLTNAPPAAPVALRELQKHNQTNIKELEIINKIIHLKQNASSNEINLSQLMDEAEGLLSTLSLQQDELNQYTDLIREMAGTIAEQTATIEELRSRESSTDKMDSLIERGASLHSPNTVSLYPDSICPPGISAIFGIFLPYFSRLPESRTLSAEERELRRLCQNFTNKNVPGYATKYFDAIMLSVCFELGIGVLNDQNTGGISNANDLSPREVSHLSKLAQALILFRTLNNLDCLDRGDDFERLLKNIELEIYALSDGSIFDQVLSDKADDAYTLYDRVLSGDSLGVVIHEEEAPRNVLRARCNL